VDWYSEQFVQTGRAPAVWALFGFLVTFAITRWITRRIRTKNAQPKPLDAEQDGGKGGFSDIYIGGVHVHHQVWGIMLVLVTGLLEFRFNPESPWSEVLAALFGAGAALVLDEFALWFHLDDVYWGEAGRKSIDAILIGGALGFVLLLQANPFGVDESIDEPGTWGYYLTITFNMTCAVLCFLKGKVATGLIGIPIPLVSLIGAIRLAKPTSLWARRRYRGRRAHRMERSHRRFDEEWARRRDRLRDFIGGSHGPAPEPPDTAAASGTQHLRDQKRELE
jgi:hypothetical protein